RGEGGHPGDPGALRSGDPGRRRGRRPREDPGGDDRAHDPHGDDGRRRRRARAHAEPRVMHVRPGLPIALAAALAACADDAAAPADEHLAPSEGEELSGGDTTVFDTTRDAYARPARNMDQAGRNEFALGDHLFNRGWVTAPASAEGNDGLGPLYN